MIAHALKHHPVACLLLACLTIATIIVAYFPETTLG